MDEKTQHSRNRKCLFAMAGIALLLAVAAILALALTQSGRVRTIRTLHANDFFLWGSQLKFPIGQKAYPMALPPPFSVRIWRSSHINCPTG